MGKYRDQEETHYRNETETKFRTVTEVQYRDTEKTIFDTKTETHYKEIPETTYETKKVLKTKYVYREDSNDSGDGESSDEHPHGYESADSSDDGFYEEEQYWTDE